VSSLRGGQGRGAAAAAGPRPREPAPPAHRRRRKEARKNRLHAVAGEVKTSGRDQQVFKESEYAVSEVRGGGAGHVCHVGPRLFPAAPRRTQSSRQASPSSAASPADRGSARPARAWARAAPSPQAGAAAGWAPRDPGRPKPAGSPRASAEEYERASQHEHFESWLASFIGRPPETPEPTSEIPRCASVAPQVLASVVVWNTVKSAPAPRIECFRG
jgi:hypothetical protein